MCGVRRPPKGRAQCLECCERGKEYKRAKQRAKRCHTCNQPIDGTNKNYCIACAKDNAQRVKAYRANNIQNGRCAYCGGVSITSGKEPLCEKCWFRRMAKERAGGQKNAHLVQNLIEQQGWRCAYTGRPLIAGKNASLDHIIPRSRGGSDSVDNLQWVDSQINLMKTDMTHEEFLETMNIIIERFDNGCTLQLVQHRR